MAREVDDFIALYQDPKATELEIHNFFSANPKFLYLLGAYNKVLSEVSFFGTAKDAERERKCFRLDFLLQHYQNVWDVVEIKKATLGSGGLIVGPSIGQDLHMRSRTQSLRFACIWMNWLKAKCKRSWRAKAYSYGNRRHTSLSAAMMTSQLVKAILEQPLPHSIECLTYDDLAELAKQNTLIEIKSVQFPLSRLQEDVSDASGPPEIPLDVPGDDQVRQAIENPSAAELLRLRSYARWQMKDVGKSAYADDLLQEAILATLEGRRIWRERIPSELICSAQ